LFPKKSGPVDNRGSLFDREGRLLRHPALIRYFSVKERLVGAVSHAGRYFLVLAEVALDHYVLGSVQPGHAQRAGEGAGAAADAALFSNCHQGGKGVAGKGAGEAGADTGSIDAVLTAHGERDGAAFVHAEAGQGAGELFFIGFDEVFGLGVFLEAIDLAEVAAHADLFFDNYLFHIFLEQYGIR
jgi:hypothetical protein